MVEKIRVVGNLIVVADALRSLDILRWTEPRLTFVARDHSSLWPLSLGALDERTSILAEVRTDLI